jgi:hypothetical protein
VKIDVEESPKVTLQYYLSDMVANIENAILASVAMHGGNDRINIYPAWPFPLECTFVLVITVTLDEREHFLIKGHC